MIGVHTPELAHERERAAVVAFVEEHALAWPQLLDNDYAYWRALSNQYWPAFYVVDRGGRIRGRFVGETHVGDSRARQIETAIERLLGEPASEPSP